MSFWISEFLNAAYGVWGVALLNFAILFVMTFTLGHRMHGIIVPIVLVVIFRRIDGLFEWSFEARNLGVIVSCLTLGFVGFLVGRKASEGFSNSMRREAK